jgi:hypothetical protein
MVRTAAAVLAIVATLAHGQPTGGIAPTRILPLDVAVAGAVSTSLGGNADDWDPSGWSSASTIRVDTTGTNNYTVTGLAGGANGRLAIITNIDTTDTVTFAAGPSASVDANEFVLARDYPLGPLTTVVFRYDGTSSRWRLMEASGTLVQENGTNKGTAHTINFADNSVSIAAGKATVSAGAAYLLDSAGMIGAAADFGATVDLQGKTLTTPNGTADRSGTCTAGDLYGESDDLTYTLSGLSYCRSTNTWTWIPAMGNSASDNMILRANSAADPTGSLAMCPTAGDIGTAGVACMMAVPNGVTMGNGFATYSVLSVPSTAPVTQDTEATGGFGGVFPYVNVFADNFINTATSGVSTRGQHLSFLSQPTLRNETNANQTSLVFNGFVAAPTPSETGTGDLTIATMRGFRYLPAQTYATTVTLSEGFQALSPGVTAANAGCVGPGNPWSCCTGAGTGTSADQCAAGTLTDSYGFRADINTGSNRHPFTAVEGAITGAPASNEGDWGVENTSPNRFWFRNESGHIWRTGYLTATGRGTALATTAVTRYFPVFTSAAADATETNVDAGSPGAITVYAMTCGLNVAAGAGTDAHAITLMDDTSPTAATCTITTTATNCQYRSESGISIAAPSLLDYRDVTTDTPVENEITCVLVYNLGVW